ncbi:hypothetical protein BS78_K149400 [Paspalum vaginatum]|uniref:Alpha/beta hydrolase fold-3 domain-containing protein n=1 Tax=Paspalum vaginatum TaxID=158149 RepID=A0A9W8CCT9_9POAL|nr:hypothetical protein BS78_K146000 [Paspalum vaginatum]KAJ1255840.1 hypothetical protein BS78_K149400 [Paspalum vaginatum]
MHAKNSSLVVNVADVDADLYPFIVRYKDGRIERFLSSPFVAASDNPSANRGVATRDVVIDTGTGVSARLFLPSQAARGMATRRRLPVVVYIHGGSFCTESAFCRTYHRYATSLAASAGALVVSVEYRLAPEHPIPTAYDDAWSALRWVASLADPWLDDYADPRRTFVAGDSAGGNIAYHTAVQASNSIGISIEGVIIVQPYFWGPERLPSEAAWDGASMLPPDRVDRLWPFVTAGQASNDDARINPPDVEIASLACRRVLVAVAEKDTLRNRGLRLFSRIRDSARTAGEVTLVESEGEDHGFHLYSPLRATSRKLMESMVNFVNQPLVLGVPTRPFDDPFGYGMDMKRHCTTTMAYGRTTSASSKTCRGNVSKANYGLFACPAVRPNKVVYSKQGPSAVALLRGTHVFNIF